jgi:hypothetical protein
MDAERFIEEMFKAEPEIRYIAIVNEQYQILASKQREGVPSLTSDETERNFTSIVPRIIVESVEKLAPFLGPVGGITAHYEKVLVIFYRTDNLVVVISIQPQVETPFYNRITEAFTKYSARHLA